MGTPTPRGTGGRRPRTAPRSCTPSGAEPCSAPGRPGRRRWRPGGLDRPASFTTDAGGRSPVLRRILVDLHDEYARHVGHADLLREAVDGLVGEDPPQG
ncbi:DUF664 domain-containing protein [Blastococcus saxobsidens]|uniref:mycothiol transferase n=1 Tax=Blastococcus saxobsidens TaxID=138336 RepID=UPI0031F2E16C